MTEAVAGTRCLLCWHTPGKYDSRIDGVYSKSCNTITAKPRQLIKTLTLGRFLHSLPLRRQQFHKQKTEASSENASQKYLTTFLLKQLCHTPCSIKVVSFGLFFHDIVCCEKPQAKTSLVQPQIPVSNIRSRPSMNLDVD